MAQVPIGTTETDEDSEVQGHVNQSFEALATPLQEGPAPLADWGVAAPTPVTEGLADLTRTKIARQEPVLRQTEQRLEEDRALMKRQIEATGVQPGELTPWDQDKAREKYATDPLQAFGSLGSVFAMIASAFTRDPMTNALNGAAAAMNAVREGNDREYTRAYTAWKDNNDLAVKRHNIQQHSYDNAIRLMDTDMKLGQEKMRIEAARFGDQKTLWLLENGMDKEVIDLQRQRSEAIKSNVEASTMLTQDGFRRATMKTMMSDYDAQVANIQGQSPAEIAGRKLAVFNHIFGKAIPVQQEGFGLLLMGMPDQPIEKVIAKAQEMGLVSRGYGGSPATKNAEILRRTKLYEEDPDSTTFGNHQGSYDRAAKEVQDANKATPNPSMQGANAASFDALLADIRTEHPDWTDGQQRAEANKQMAASKTAVSGNKEVELKQRINKFTHATETADKILGVLERHKGAAGIAGKVMRLEERLGNILGSKSTDYVQMMRDVELLRGWSKELLFSKNERLKAEGQRINDIIAGTSSGDTQPNTVRALKDAKRLLQQMKSEDEQILKGGGPGTRTTPGSEAPAGAKPTEGQKPWWQDAPLKKSAVDDEEGLPETALAMSGDDAYRKAIRATEELRRKLGVPASTPGGRDTDSALKAIEDALKLAPK